MKGDKGEKRGAMFPICSSEQKVKVSPFLDQSGSLLKCFFFGLLEDCFSAE